MGLFSHKKDTSPSGFFSTEMTPTEERSERDAIGHAGRSSTSSNPNRMSQDSPRDTHSSTGAGVGAAAAATAATGAAAASRNHGTDTRDDAEPQVDTSRSTGPLTNELNTSSSRSAGLPAGAAPSGTTRSTSGAATGPTSAAGVTGASAGLASLGTHDESTGVNRGASIREHAAAPHRHHDQNSPDVVLSEEQAKLAEHDHKYLQPVVHERRHIHEVEELERHRVVDRHVHHVQHHVQPLLDERHLEVVHSYREVPVTHVEETHANSAEDRALLARLNAQSMSTYTVVPHHRVTVDKGETQVVENVVHHYHTIVMPVWQRDLHEFYRLNSNFSPATMLNSSGGPASSTSHQPNIASRAVQAGAGAGPSFGSVSHPPGASVVPGGISMMGPPQPREGHKLVPDNRAEVGGEGTQYEVEYVNREPVYTASAVQHGVTRQGGGASGLYQEAASKVPSAATGSTHRHDRTSSLGQTTAGGNLPTTVGGHQPLPQQSSGLEHGVQNMNLGVAR